MDYEANKSGCLVCFCPEHSKIFFGRETEIQRLNQQLIASNGHGLTLVLGAANSGKYSLVQARVIPKLQQQELIFDHLITSPSALQADPLTTFCEQLFTVLPSLVSSNLAKHPNMIGSAIDMAIQQWGTDQHNNTQSNREHLLIFIDQFEEFFNGLCHGSANQHQLFLLIAQLASSIHVHLIIGLGSQYYQDWCEEPRLNPVHTETQQFYLNKINSEQLNAIIQAPATIAGLTFEHNAHGDSLQTLSPLLSSACPYCNSPYMHYMNVANNNSLMPLTNNWGG